MKDKFRIVVINVHFGAWPSWMEFYLTACAANKTIDFLLFSNKTLDCNSYSNIRSIQISESDFSLLVAKTTGLQIYFDDPYKLCDLKPAYAKIFEEYLSGYDFWAYSDIDIIPGQLNKWFTQELLADFNIISLNKRFLSGPFTLFKNSHEIRNLYSHISDYKEKLQNPQWMGFDEKIHRARLKGVSIRKILWACIFMFNLNILRHIFHGRKQEIRYQFQWFYKKKMFSTNTIPIDMTEMVWLQEKNRKLKVKWADWIASENKYSREGRANTKLAWRNGKLFNLSTQKEICIYHFHQTKTNHKFQLDFSPEHNSFSITPKGI